jgi:vancomycin resistance protein YoaR
MNTKQYLCFFVVFFLTTTTTSALAAEDKTPTAVNGTDPIKTLTISVDQYTEEIPSETLNKWLVQKSNLEFSLTYKTEFENITYCPVSKSFCDFSLPISANRHLKLTSQTITDRDAASAYLEDLARKVNHDPVDAKFTVTDGKVTTFTESQDGLTLDIPNNLETLLTAVTTQPTLEKIALRYDLKKPAITYSEVNNLGISSLIGEGTSNFKGSPTNRIHNIKVATDRYNGVLIKPGEEFSFVSFLGEVDAEHGYLPELVIKQGVTEPEFGGGICQVSTTAFRAAIFSGLKITARKNHAYPVSYYNPQGMDSTVYIPRPDLRFLNNTPSYILIQTKIVGTVLTFSFYGTDDGRKTSIDGPTITERKPDGALKASVTQLVVAKDGKEIIKDVFNSSYASPYKYPHPGGPTLSVRPSNWSEEEWKNYKKTLSEIAEATAKAKP